jgi:RND family efflux transporter MFP subunit
MNTKSGKTIWVAVCVFVCFIALVFIIQKNTASAGLAEKKPAAEKTGEKTIPVKVSRVTQRKIVKTLNIYGKIEAFQSAYVSPRIAGTIEKLCVDEGDQVERNKTVLFHSESIRLQQKLSNARQNLPIALATEKERKAQLSKAEIDFKRKSKSFERYKSLYSKNAIAKDVFDGQEADYLTAAAEVEHKKALLEIGQAEVKQAQINLAMAEKDLADSVVLAPIDGFVTEKLIETGETGQPGKPAFKIDNLAKVQVSAYIPAEYGNLVSANQTEAELFAYGQKIGERIRVTYVSPVIDAKLHIFEIKCLVDNGGYTLKPGQSVQARIFLNEHSSTTVPTASLIETGNESAIFICENNVVKKIKVVKGSDSDGWTEIIEPQLQVGSQVISEGQFLLKDSMTVTVIN